ncbi:MAG: AbiV family abortive infection protein [Pseudomonadota bacterium]
MSGDNNDERAIRACHSNAAGLIRSARLIVEHGGLMSAAYHLALLAIEEVGKASLLRIHQLEAVLTHERPSINRKIDDHFQKLFYAFFLPAAFGKGLSRKDVEDARSLAGALHQKRLDSLYVTPGESDHILEISPQEAENTLGLAEARLAMEEGLSNGSPEPEVLDALKWVFETIADEERKRFVFSKRSIEELENSKGVVAWVRWIREQFAAEQEAMRRLIESEVSREAPSDEDAANVKWKMKVRLVVVSHSVRQKNLNWWNASVERIKLRESDKKKRELIAEIHLPKAVPIQGLWHVGYGEIRRLVLALNIGTMGFCWWYSLNRENMFYDALTDVENNANLDLHEQNKFLYIDWGARAIQEGDLRNVALCYVFLPTPRASAEEQKPFGEYLTALAFLAKTDLHLNLTANACGLFFRALTDAMKLYGDMATEESFSAAFQRNMAWIITEEEDQRSFVELARTLEQAGSDTDFSALTLDKVLQAKILCDAYFIRKFQQQAAERSQAARRISAAPGSDGDLHAGTED